MLLGAVTASSWVSVFISCFNPCDAVNGFRFLFVAPTWEELAKKYGDHKDKIVIAKMDSTANEVQYPGVSVRGFPTLYFFKAGSKGTPIKYEDKRELDSLVSFIEENAHHAEAVSSKDEL